MALAPHRSRCPCAPLPARPRRASAAARSSALAAPSAAAAAEEEAAFSLPAASPDEAAEHRSLLVAATRRIRDLGAARDAVGAVDQLAQLGARGVAPDLLAFTATLRACVVAGDTPRAQRVFDELVGARRLRGGRWRGVGRRGQPPPRRPEASHTRLARPLAFCPTATGSGAIIPDEMAFLVLLQALGERTPVVWARLLAPASIFGANTRTRR